MAIFRVLGLIIAIVAIRALLPEIFSQGEHIVFSFLTLTSKILSIATLGIENVADVGSGVSF